MKYSILILCAGILISLSACNKTGESEKKTDAILFEAAFSNPVKLKASDCFKKIRYIPLETSDSCLIGRNADVRLFGDKIMVTSSPKQCMVFDRNGRFISSVGHVGDDPEGYSQTKNWIDERTGVLYFKGWNGNLIAYEDNGAYKSSIPIPGSVKTVSGEFEFLSDGTMIQYTNDMFTDNDYLLFFKNDKVVKKMEGVSYEKDSVKFNPSDIQSISVMKGESMPEAMPVSLGSILIMKFKDSDKGLVYPMEASCLWRVEDDVFFKPVYNDTIYQVVDTALIPVRFFDLGKHHWEYRDRFNMKHKDGVLISQILDSRKLMLSRILTNVFDKLTSYNAVFDKATGVLKVGEYKDGFEDDLTHFIPLQPNSVSTTGEYASLLPAEKIITWFDENKNSTDLPEDVECLKQIGEEDNPVVVIME